MVHHYAKQLSAAIENLLGNESLTADLDDNAAQVLLNWAIEQVQTIYADGLEQAFDLDNEKFEAIIHPRMKALRRFVRQVNLWTANRGYQTPAENAQALDTLAGLLQEISGTPAHALGPEARQRFLETHLAAPPAEFIRRILYPPAPTPPNQPPDEPAP